MKVFSQVPKNLYMNSYCIFVCTAPNLCSLSLLTVCKIENLGSLIP